VHAKQGEKNQTSNERYVMKIQNENEDEGMNGEGSLCTDQMLAAEEA
jgi:hypothetical protein